MSQQVFSREYLKNLPELEKQRRKEEFIRDVIISFQNQLVADAKSGKTCYVWEMWKYTDAQPYQVSSHKFEIPSAEEMIEGFQKKFPDCKIYQDEKWVETKPDTKVLKKGIVIDWS